MKSLFLLFSALIAFLPADCTGQDPGATLRAHGNVSVNGNLAQPLSTIFPQALIGTEKESSALIEVSGARVEIGAESIVEFDGNELRLEHGSLNVLTFRSMQVKVSCLAVLPVHSEETLFSVIGQSGRVTVSAARNDVNIRQSTRSPKETAAARSEQFTVRQGEQKSWSEKCGGPPYQTHAAPAAIAGLMNSPYAQGVAAGGIGILCYFICVNDDPVSPVEP